jgi:excisionase family DNA binding protein
MLYFTFCILASITRNRTRVTIAQKGGTTMTTVRHRPETEALLTPSEVATLFRVDPKTVTRWAKAGKLTSIRTLGGHRRYRESEVRSLLDGNTVTAEG